jgi:hypothetical protein
VTEISAQHNTYGYSSKVIEKWNDGEASEQASFKVALTDKQKEDRDGKYPYTIFAEAVGEPRKNGRLTGQFHLTKTCGPGKERDDYRKVVEMVDNSQECTTSTCEKVGDLEGKRTLDLLLPMTGEKWVEFYKPRTDAVSGRPLFHYFQEQNIDCKAVFDYELDFYVRHNFDDSFTGGTKNTNLKIDKYSGAVSVLNKADQKVSYTYKVMITNTGGSELVNGKDVTAKYNAPLTIEDLHVSTSCGPLST